MSMTDWSESEELYLTELTKISQYLSQRYNSCYLEYKRHQTRIKLPSICLSSIASLLSFGTSVFPKEYHSAVNISVGCSAMLVALVGTIESFLKIPEIVAGSLEASMNYLKLAEHISVELSLPRHKRTAPGIVFLREAYKTYEKHSEASPNVFRTVRFVKPFPYSNKTGQYQESLIEDGNSEERGHSDENTPSTLFNGRSLDIARYGSRNMDTPDAIVYVPTDGYALKAPRPPAAIDLPV